MAEQSPVTSPEATDGVRKPFKMVLEDMSKEDLVRQVKRQLILLQKTKNKCDEYNKRIAELENESVSETSTDSLQIQEIKSTSENDSLENKQLQEQLIACQASCAALQKEKYSLQEQFDCMKLKMDTLSETCQFLQKDCTDLQHQKNDFLDQVAVLTEARDSSLQSLKGLKDQLNVSQEQLDAIQAMLKQSEEEQQFLVGRLEDCCAQLEAATNQNASMQEDYATMRTRWRDATDECDSLKSRIEELEADEESVGKNQIDLQNRLQVVMSELEETKNECRELRNENEEKSDATKELEGRVCNLDEEVKRLSCERDNLKSSLEESSEKGNTEQELRNQLFALEKELELASGKCVEFQELWERQNNATNSLQEELRALQSDRENRASAQDNRETSDLGPEDCTSEKEENLKQIEKLELERDQLLLKVDQIISELHDEKSKWHLEKENLNQEKEDGLQKLLQIETQSIDSKTEIQHLMKETESLKLEKEEYLQKMQRIDDGDSALALQLTEAVKKVKNLEENLTKSHDQKQDLVEELTQVRDLQKFLEDEAKELREEYEKTKIEIKRLDADLENDSLHIRHLEKELRQAEEREHESNKTVETLHRHLFCMEDALRATEQHLEERSEMLKQEMEAELEATRQELLQMKEEAEENASEYEKHKIENRELKAHISELSSVIQNRTDEMKTEEWEKEKSYLEEQLILQRETNEQLNLEMSELKESLLSLRDNMEKLLQLKPQVGEECKDAESLDSSEDLFGCAGGISPIVKREPCDEIDELLKMNAVLREDLKRADDRSVDLHEEVDTKCEMMEKMLIEMNNLVSQIDDMNAIIIEKEQDLESVVAKLESQTENVKRLGLELKEKDDLLILLRSGTPGHEPSESSLDIVDKRVEEFLEKLPEKEACVLELLQKNESLLLEVESVNYQKHQLQEQVNLLRKELHVEESGTVHADRSQDVEEIIRPTSPKEVSGRENEQLQEHIHLINQEIVDSNQYEEANQNTEEFIGTVKKEEMQLQDLQEIHQHLEEVIEMKEKKEQVCLLNQELIECVPEYEGCIASLKEEKEQLLEKVILLTQELEESNKKFKSANQHFEEVIESLKAERESSPRKEELEEQVRLLTQELEESNKRFTEANQHFEEVFESLKAERDSSPRKEELEEQVELLTRELEESNNKFKSANQHFEDVIESLKAERDSSPTKEELEEQVELLTGELEESNKRFTEANMRFEEVFESLKTERDSTPTKEELEEQVCLLTREFEEAKRHFEDNFVLLKQQEEMDVIEKGKLRVEIDLLRNSLEESETKCMEICQRLEDSHKTAEMVEGENSKLNDEVDSMRIVIQNLEEEVKILRGVPLNSKEELEMVKTEGTKVAEEKLEQQLRVTEEKMAKFKALAVKAKKELAETKREIAELKRERNNFVHQIEDLSTSSRQHLLNFQSLQGEYDNLQDECEALKDASEKTAQSVVAMETEAANLKAELTRLNSENSRMQLAIESAAVEKKTSEQARCEAESRVIVLKSEKESEQKKLDVAKSEATKLNQKIKSLEEQLTAEKEQHKTTAQKLDHKLKEAKQQSVLDLEIADYEHSISELNEQLASKETEITVLQEELSRHAQRIASLTEQIGSLEGQHDAEEERVRSLKSVLAKAKEEAAEMRECSQKQQEQISVAKFELENVTALKEEFQVQLAESSAEISSLRDSIRNIKESHARVYKSCESRLASLEEERGSSKHELELTRQEFDCYKVRVHNVLKQKQQPAVVNVMEQERKQRLEKSVEQLQMKLQQLSDELHTRNVEMETLQQEHDHLSERHARVMEDLRRKDEIWMNKVEQLKMEHVRHQTSWEAHRKELQHQIELVEANYKQRATELDMMRKVELAELHSKLVEKEKELGRCQKELVVAPSHPSPHEDTPFDILTQERQEGEGSECADTLTPYKPLSLVTIPTSGYTTLEQLLQSSSDPENPETVPQDIESLSLELSAAYKKLDHLTELLNESEASNMRMSEQVRILKEEIRRMERNKEREELSSNLEYLKNIVLKFLMLQGDSERQRLLPVLATVLKLSPEEQTQLQTVTIGEPSDPAAAAGWGNYLHRWSGLM